MALLHIAYERLLNAIHNEDTLAIYRTKAAARPAAVRGRWFDPQALMLRESIQRWIGFPSPAPSRCGCAVARTTRSSTPRART